MLYSRYIYESRNLNNLIQMASYISCNFFSFSYINIKYSVRNINSSTKVSTREQRISYCWLPGNFSVLDTSFVKIKKTCKETLYLLEKLMLDVKVVRRAAISDGTQGSRRGIDVIVIIAWQWYRSIIDCRFASLPLLRVTLSSLIVVLGVLRLTRCSRCSYIHFFFLTMTVPRYIFFYVVRIALSFLPFSLFFTSAYLGCSSFNSVFRRCTRCQWLFSVLRCRPMLVVASLRDGNTCIARFCKIVCTRNPTRIRFAIGNTDILQNWKYHYWTSFYRASKINSMLSKNNL